MVAILTPLCWELCLSLGAPEQTCKDANSQLALHIIYLLVWNHQAHPSSITHLVYSNARLGYPQGHRAAEGHTQSNIIFNIPPPVSRKYVLVVFNHWCGGWVLLDLCTLPDKTSQASFCACIEVRRHFETINVTASCNQSILDDSFLNSPAVNLLGS